MKNTDYFSEQSKAYKENRPTYPNELFDWLATMAPSRVAAWDCGCGNGQATVSLARYFDQVIATDLSNKQIDLAEQKTNIRYSVEPAEKSSIVTQSIDLTFTSQALHWFNHELFFSEVKRVSKPNAIFSALTYNLLSIAPELDALLLDFYSNIVGPYWPPERKHVENNYNSIPFPFKRIESPSFCMSANWSIAQFIGYIQSWSSVTLCRTKTGSDPLASLIPQIKQLWGDSSISRAVSWPITLLTGQIDS
jgi:ubiquinone/menaquinone biosynthesis C-methylase UbiE